MRKLGFSGQEIAAMGHAEAGAWLDAYAEVVNPDTSGKTYVVKKKDRKKGIRRG